MCIAMQSNRGRIKDIFGKVDFREEVLHGSQNDSGAKTILMKSAVSEFCLQRNSHRLQASRKKLHCFDGVP